MRGNFAVRRVVGAARLIVVVAAVPLTLSPVAYGQTSQQSSEPTPDQMLATRRCDSELDFIMARDNGGRNPNAAVDARRRTVRQGSGSQWSSPVLAPMCVTATIAADLVSPALEMLRDAV